MRKDRAGWDRSFIPPDWIHGWDAYRKFHSCGTKSECARRVWKGRRRRWFDSSSLWFEDTSGTLRHINTIFTIARQR
jgi:hypothetical protein